MCCYKTHEVPHDIPRVTRRHRTGDVIRLRTEVHRYHPLVPQIFPIGAKSRFPIDDAGNTLSHRWHIRKLTVFDAVAGIAFKRSYKYMPVHHFPSIIRYKFSLFIRILKYPCTN